MKYALPLLLALGACAQPEGLPPEFSINGKRYWPKECQDFAALRSATAATPIHSAPALTSRRGAVYQSPTPAYPLGLITAVEGTQEDLILHEKCHRKMEIDTGSPRFHS